MIHSPLDGLDDLMRVALVLPRADVTEWEARLARSISQLQGVAAVSVLLIRTRPTSLERAQRLRAMAERRIARMRIGAADFGAIPVEEIAASDLWRRIEAMGVDAVVSLSAAIPESNTRADVLELWLDGRRSEGLGLLRASGPPPRDVTVTNRREGVARVARKSVLTTTPGVEAGDRRNAAMRSVALLVRALRNRDGVGEVWRETIDAPRPLATLGMSGRVVINALLRKLRGLFFVADWWHLAYRTSSASEFREVDCGVDRFQADPVAISVDGVEVVFFEEYVYAERRGVISCALVGADGTLGAARRVLERPYHLSYPFVFVHDGTLFMIPETSEQWTVELYRCTKFAHEWRFEATLLSNIYATDATLHFDGIRWWMFLTVGEEGSYTWDELHLYMADLPFGPWLPHPRNPVKSDSRSARPAGPLFHREGRLIRPTQDCSETYGGAINLCAIDVLTPEEFREQVIDRIPPDAIPGADGLHTLSATERIEVIDVRTPRRFRWPRLNARRGA